MFSTTDTGLIFHFAESLNCYTKINNFSIQNDISGSLMETGENPVQCRCCVGGVFFIMPLEQLFREGGESEDAQVRIQALNVSDSLRATAQQIIYHSAEYRFCVQIRT